jgi:mono/diheme cytochrome c family protein
MNDKSPEHVNPSREEIDRREGDSTRVVDLHEPIAREMAEPKDGFEPPPMWMLFLFLALMGFGGWYLGTYSGGFDALTYDELAGPRAGGVQAEDTETVVDPMVLGRRVYNNCSACHQPDGSGVAGNYPPLDGSSWVTGSPETITAVVLAGLEGEINVDGERYNQVMPSWQHLSDEQVAAVLTYVRASWSNDAPPVAEQVVAGVRDRLGGRTRALTVDELEQLDFGDGETLGS